MGPVGFGWQDTLGFQIKGFELLSKSLELHPAGFEPALPKETELKSVALDHSANLSFIRILKEVFQ